jgi:hypothetical protein
MTVKLGPTIARDHAPMGPTRGLGRWLEVLEREMTAAPWGGQGRADCRAAWLPLASEPFTAPIGFFAELHAQKLVKLTAPVAWLLTVGP